MDDQPIVVCIVGDIHRSYTSKSRVTATLRKHAKVVFIDSTPSGKQPDVLIIHDYARLERFINPKGYDAMAHTPSRIKASKQHGPRDKWGKLK